MPDLAALTAAEWTAIGLALAALAAAVAAAAAVAFLSWLGLGLVAIRIFVPQAGRELAEALARSEPEAATGLLSADGKGSLRTEDVAEVFSAVREALGPPRAHRLTHAFARTGPDGERLGEAVFELRFATAQGHLGVKVRRTGRHLFRRPGQPPLPGPAYTLDDLRLDAAPLAERPFSPWVGRLDTFLAPATLGWFSRVGDAAPYVPAGRYERPEPPAEGEGQVLVVGSPRVLLLREPRLARGVADARALLLGEAHVGARLQVVSRQGAFARVNVFEGESYVASGFVRREDLGAARPAGAAPGA